MLRAVFRQRSPLSSLEQLRNMSDSDTKQYVAKIMSYILRE